MTKHDICTLIQNDPWMMGELRIVQELNLPDWWIGAGFVRGKVWDHLHGYTQRTALPDIDVIYFEGFDPSDTEIVAIKQLEKKLETKLKAIKPELNWSITNQARMHLFHKHKPYKNSTEALAQWVETATCVGVSLDKQNRVILTTPRGIVDLVELKLRPTPDHSKDPKTFFERIEKKQWLTKWPKLKIVI